MRFFLASIWMIKTTNVGSRGSNKEYCKSCDAFGIVVVKPNASRGLHSREGHFYRGLGWGEIEERRQKKMFVALRGFGAKGQGEEVCFVTCRFDMSIDRPTSSAWHLAMGMRNLVEKYSGRYRRLLICSQGSLLQQVLYGGRPDFACGLKAVAWLPRGNSWIKEERKHNGFVNTEWTSQGLTGWAAIT